MERAYDGLGVLTGSYWICKPSYNKSVMYDACTPPVPSQFSMPTVAVEPNDAAEPMSVW